MQGMDDKAAELSSSSDEPVTYTHHLHPGAPTYMRRGSLRPPDGASSKNGLLVQQRPLLQGRTNSASLVEQHKHFTKEPHLTGRYFPNGRGGEEKTEDAEQIEVDNDHDDDVDDDEEEEEEEDEQFYTDYDNDNDDNNDDLNSNYNEHPDQHHQDQELDDDDIDDEDDDKSHEQEDHIDHSTTRFTSFPLRSFHVPAWHGEANDYAPPVPPTRFDSLPASMLQDRITEINVAVIGAAGVGKTTFLQKALDLPTPPYSGSAEQKIAYHSAKYLVRLLEIPIDKVNVDDDDDIIAWPDIIGNKMTPRIDGALTLYDVRDKSSLDQVPEVLTALSKASVPSILISCKCDVAPFERDLDPVAIEEKAKRSVRNLVTLQTSNATSDNHKRGISMIIRAITARAGGEIGAAKRRRAQSNALRHVSPTPNVLKKHIRATSEHSTIALRGDRVRRQSRLIAHSSADQLSNLAELPADTTQRSFLFEESGTDSSNDSSGSSNDAEDPSIAITGTADQLSGDGGATFDQLVDRLLAQPMSKSDVKFSTIFLALYRKFAPPARLLEGIIDRFNAVDRLVVSELTKTTAQLRYLTILEQWIRHYPGDFAFPKTKRRMQNFTARIGPVAVLSAAANEMTRDLAAVHDNDDTHWAYNDQDREVDDLALGYSALPTSQQGLDELEFSIPESLSGLTVTDDVALAATLIAGSADRPTTESSTSSSQMMLNVNVAQREAKNLEPTERLRLSKDHWRMLMEISDDVVASEMTRIDWIMFSSIRPRDLVRHVSLNPSGKDACVNLVNVDRMINHFNRTAAWVSNFILLRDKPKHRSMMLEKFMRVARKLRELNNYNSLGAIIAGIKSSPIHRLAATRELLSPAVGKDWLKLEILLSPTRSHSAYRLAWENSPNERIPYIPLHRRDLVSAEEGNKTFIGDDAGGRINWKKFEIMGEVIVGLQRAQDLPYHGLAGWKGGEQVNELLLGVQLVRDEEELYRRSIQCEPPANAGATTTTARFKEFFKR